MDDIVRQFKGVSDGLMRKVVGSPLEENDHAPARHLSWSVHDINTHLSKEIATESMNSSISDTEDIDKLGESTQGEGRLDSAANGWHSDNELDSKYFPPRVVRRLGEPENLPSGMENDFKSKSEVRGSIDLQHADPSTTLVQNPTGMPPEVHHKWPFSLPCIIYSFTGCHPSIRLCPLAYVCSLAEIFHDGTRCLSCS